MFNHNNIAMNVDVKDAQGAIEAAGELLVDCGYASPSFVKAMVDVFFTLGSYIVIAPGLAFPHARPEAGAIKSGFSLITLKEPVNFGNIDNDPVKVVIAMAAINNRDHISSLKFLGELFSDYKVIDLVSSAQTKEEIINIFQMPMEE